MGCGCDSGGCAAAPSSEAMSEAEAREALCAHARRTGCLIHERFGPAIDLATVERMLEDPDVVRFPVSLLYDGTALEGEEIAYPLPVEGDPLNGYTMYLHPALEGDPEGAVRAILYALVVVNYGAVADGAVGEAFGAAALGIEEEQYYEQICSLVDAIHHRSASR